MAIQVLFTIYSVIDNNIVLNIPTKTLMNGSRKDKKGKKVCLKPQRRVF